MESTNLIINKTLEFEEYTIDFLERNIGKLSLAGKFHAYLLAYLIIIDRLKAFGAYNVQRIDILGLTTKFVDTYLIKFKDYKSIYSFGNYEMGYGAFHIRTNNEAFFKKDIEDIRYDSLNMIDYLTLDLDNPFAFNVIFTNLYIHPFINIDMPFERQKAKMTYYINSEIEVNHYDETDFRNQIIRLIDALTEKMNSDSYFLDKIGRNKLQSNASNKNCYIATLVYADIDHPKVEFLRQYRDTKLLTTFGGKLFVKLYYFTSPTLVKTLKPFKKIQLFIKIILDEMIKKISKTE